MEPRHHESVNALTRFFAAVSEPIFVHDSDYRIIYCNIAYCDLCGLPREALLGHPYWEHFPLGDGPLASCRAGREQSNGEHQEYVLEQERVFESRSYPMRDDDGHYCFSVHVMLDVTHHYWQERALKTLSNSNRTLIYADDYDRFITDVCHNITDNAGYTIAWLGLLEEEGGVEVISAAGIDRETLKQAGVGCSVKPGGHCCAATIAARENRIEVIQDITLASVGVPLDPNRYGFRSICALPLNVNGGEPFGVLTLYSPRPNAFFTEEVELLEELAGDIAFGINKFQMGDERVRLLEANQQKSARLHQALLGSLLTIRDLVEARDPYTAGHQDRVAQLSKAIAERLGLPDQQVRGIFFGALIHDVGKIRVPSELLAKPGRLSEGEFSLIKEHCAAGYALLKNHDYPWPVADMAHQHHERFDGSGYPLGLKGEQLRLESRIIAVADVVEAMASHRPYRAALGIEAALDEIRRMRGTFYDPSVVDACLELFDKQLFTFDQALASPIAFTAE